MPPPTDSTPSNIRGEPNAVSATGFRQLGPNSTANIGTYLDGLTINNNFAASGTLPKAVLLVITHDDLSQRLTPSRVLKAHPGTPDGPAYLGQELGYWRIFGTGLVLPMSVAIRKSSG